MDEFAGEGFVLLVGPSPRLGAIAPLVAALGQHYPGEAAADVRTLADLGDLVAVTRPYGRVLLDAEEVPHEDLGLVRRFLLAHPGFEVWLTAETHDTPAARRLAPFDAVRLVPWPLDVEQLSVFAEPFAFEDAVLDDDGELEYDEEYDDGEDLEAGFEHEGPIPAERWKELAPPAPPGPAARPSAPHDDDPEMAEIAGILSTPGAFAPPPGSHQAPRSPDAPAPEAPPGGEPSGAAGAANPPGSELPSFYREQVADLADIVQRLGLSVGAAHDSGGASGLPRLAELDGEVARLQQFTRTLGYMVAPPARGSQEFDVVVVLEEMLGTLAAGADAPRFLFKGGAPMIVRSDKALLFQAFDALLQVAAGCGGAGEKVRVSVEPDEGPEGAQTVRIRVSFPAGPLADLTPRDIVRPYALKRHLPAIGPNALAAAEGILVGQGGSLALVDEPAPGSTRSNRLAFAARLPRCATGSASGSGGNGRDGDRGPGAGPFD